MPIYKIVPPERVVSSKTRSHLSASTVSSWSDGSPDHGSEKMTFMELTEADRGQERGVVGKAQVTSPDGSVVAYHVHRGTKAEPEGEAKPETVISREIRLQKEREEELEAMHRELRHFVAHGKVTPEFKVTLDATTHSHNAKVTHETDHHKDKRSSEGHVVLKVTGESRDKGEEGHKEVVVVSHVEGHSKHGGGAPKGGKRSGPGENRIMRELVEQRQREEELRRYWKEIGLEVKEKESDGIGGIFSIKDSPPSSPRSHDAVTKEIHVTKDTVPHHGDGRSSQHGAGHSIASHHGKDHSTSLHHGVNHSTSSHHGTDHSTSSHHGMNHSTSSHHGADHSRSSHGEVHSTYFHPGKDHINSSHHGESHSSSSHHGKDHSFSTHGARSPSPHHESTHSTSLHLATGPFPSSRVSAPDLTRPSTPKVQPFEDVELIHLVNRLQYTPHNESLIEREVKAVLEREDALRLARGLRPLVVDDAPKVEVATLKPRSVSLVEQLDLELSMKKYAKNRLRSELLKDQQREIDLFRLGVIRSLSEHPKGEPVKYVEIVTPETEKALELAKMKRKTSKDHSLTPSTKASIEIEAKGPISTHHGAHTISKGKVEIEAKGPISTSHGTHTIPKGKVETEAKGPISTHYGAHTIPKGKVEIEAKGPISTSHGTHTISKGKVEIEAKGPISTHHGTHTISKGKVEIEAKGPTSINHAVFHSSISSSGSAKHPVFKAKEAPPALLTHAYIVNASGGSDAERHQRTRSAAEKRIELEVLEAKRRETELKELRMSMLELSGEKLPVEKLYHHDLNHNGKSSLERGSSHAISVSVKRSGSADSLDRPRSPDSPRSLSPDLPRSRAPAFLRSRSPDSPRSRSPDSP